MRNEGVRRHHVSRLSFGLGDAIVFVVIAALMAVAVWLAMLDMSAAGQEIDSAPVVMQPIETE